MGDNYKMASKIMCFMAVLCALQCVQSADVDDEVNSARTRAQAVQQSIANAEIKAQNLAKNATFLASHVTDSTLRTILQMVQEVTEKIKSFVQTRRNIQICVAEQSEAAKTVVTLAGQELQTCVQTVITRLEYFSADIKELGLQALRLVQGIPAQVSSCSSNVLTVLNCLGTVALRVSSKGLLLASSLGYDMTQLTAFGAQLPGQLAKCGTSQVAKVATQLENILSTIDACVKKISAAA